MTGATSDLGDTMGCVFFGILFAVLFYGCSCSQTVIYVREHTADKLSLKLLVGDEARERRKCRYWLSSLMLSTGGLFMGARHRNSCRRRTVQNHSYPPSLTVFPRLAGLQSWIIYLVERRNFGCEQGHDCEKQQPSSSTS
ncbi:hypothetical protein AcW1_002903 [Taiwanofungus camphoratus]|nr:hypothetical protein AcV7_005690 [Antrodia cinnamomea]KAI0942219.1 hypothetical protein AcW1_002903 [Antrodia cinnamomea]